MVVEITKFFDKNIQAFEFTLYYIIVNIIIMIFVIISSIRRAATITIENNRKASERAENSTPGGSNSNEIGCFWLFINQMINRWFIYTAFLVHIWDTGSDLGVLFTWYSDPEYRVLAYVSTALIINYRIFSSVSFYNASRSWKDIWLQFLDLQLFVDCWRSSVDDKPTDTLYWIRAMEAVLESAPQSLLQFVYLYDQVNLLVLISLLGSLASVINSLLHYDDIIFVYHGIEWYITYIVRFLFRLCEVVGRAMILALIWNTWPNGGAYVTAVVLTELIFFILLTQLQIPPWEIWAFLVTNIDLNLTFEGREGAITRPLRNNILYRLVFKPVAKMFTSYSKDDEAQYMVMLESIKHEHANSNNQRTLRRKRLLIAPAHYIWRFIESIFLVFCVCTYAFLDDQVATEVFEQKLWVLITATTCIILTPLLYFFVRAFADDSKTLERNLIALVLEAGAKRGADRELRSLLAELQLLIDAGAKLTQVDYRGNTVVHACVQTDNWQLLEEIMKRKSAPLNRRNHAGYTPCMVAAAEGAVRCLEVFAKRLDFHDQIYPEDLGGLNEGLVHLAAKKNQVGVVHYLGNYDEKLLHMTHKGEVNACHTACVHGSSDALIELINWKVNIHARVINGDTCAIIAAERGHINCLRELAIAGADLNAYGDLQHTPFYRAAINDHGSTLKWLATQGVPMNIKDAYGCPVQRACFMTSSFNALEAMAHLNMSFRCATDLINKEDKEKMTPVMWAAMYNRPFLLEHLTKYGAILDRQNQFLEAAVHFAASAGAVQCLEVLQRCGASMELKNGKGETPLQRAKEANHKECIEFLKYVTNGRRSTYREHL